MHICTAGQHFFLSGVVSFALGSHALAFLGAAGLHFFSSVWFRSLFHALVRFWVLVSCSRSSLFSSVVFWRLCVACFVAVMATQIETLKVYIIGMEYPTSLNNPSPAKPIPLARDWPTEDAQLSRRNIRHARRHVGLVLHYDSMTHIAVILLGSSSPRQCQRYIPWEGTERLPFQTSEVLRTEGPGFRNYPGYLNFTHAIRVLVLQPSAITSATNPGLACITDILERAAVNPPNVLHICLHHPQLELLKSLHSSYWAGLRYTFEGAVVGEDGDGVEDGDGQRCKFVENNEGVHRGALPIAGALPTDEVVRAEFSFKLGVALAWEDFRNSQLTMVEGDEDPGVDIDTLPKCVLGPLTEQDLQRGFSTYESAVGFPWEKELNVNGHAVQVATEF